MFSQAWWKFLSFRHDTIMLFISIKLDSSMQDDARRYDLVTNCKRYWYSNCDCTVDLTVLGKPGSYNFLKIFLLKIYLFHFKKMIVIQRMPSSKEEIKLSYCFIDCDPLQVLESRVGWSEIMKIISSYISGRSSTFLYFYFLYRSLLDIIR